MKKLYLILPLLLALNFNANAADLTLPPPPPLPTSPEPLTASYQRGVPVFEFTRQVLKDVLKVPFVIHNELLLNEESVAVDVRLLNKAQSLEVLKEILKTRGFDIRKDPLVYTVYRLPVAPSKTEAKDKKEDTEERQLLVYSPKNRPVSLFQKQLPGLFPRVYFSFSRLQSSSDEKSPLSSVEARNKEDDLLDSFYAKVPKSQVDELNTVLAALDTPIPQARIRAALYQVSSNKVEGHGASFTASFLGGKLGAGVGSAVPDKAKPWMLLSVKDFSLAFQALDGDSRFKSLTTADIVATSGKSETIQKGSSYPYQGPAVTSNGVTTQTLEFRDIGAILTIKPEIYAERINLEISFELTDVAQTSIGVTSAPSFPTSKFLANPVLKSGDMVVLGSMFTEKSNSILSKLFGISFNSTSDSVKEDLVLVLYADKV